MLAMYDRFRICLRPQRVSPWYGVVPLKSPVRMDFNDRLAHAGESAGTRIRQLTPARAQALASASSRVSNFPFARWRLLATARLFVYICFRPYLIRALRFIAQPLCFKRASRDRRECDGIDTTGVDDNGVPSIKIGRESFTKTGVESASAL